jgi:hypothetical protein
MKGLGKMFMSQKAVGVILVLTLILASSSGAWAASPDDAVTGRPGSSFNLKIRLNAPDGGLETVLAHPGLALFTAVLSSEKAGNVMYTLNLALDLQPQAVVFVVGREDGQPFLQMAVSMPKEALLMLDSIERGEATNPELMAFFTKNADCSDEKNFKPVILTGPKGPCYFLEEETVYFTARDDLLLIALFLEDLAASVEALEKSGVRVVHHLLIDAAS